MYMYIKVCIGGMAPAPPLLLNWHIVLVVLSCAVFVGIMIASYWTYRSWKEQRNQFSKVLQKVTLYFVSKGTRILSCQTLF